MALVPKLALLLVKAKQLPLATDAGEQGEVMRCWKIDLCVTCTVSSKLTRNPHVRASPIIGHCDTVPQAAHTRGAARCCPLEPHVLKIQFWLLGEATQI